MLRFIAFPLTGYASGGVKPRKKKPRADWKNTPA
jgi:hypothetical protein